MKKSVKSLVAVLLAVCVAVLCTSCSDWFVDDDVEYESGTGDLIWRGVRYKEFIGMDISGLGDRLARFSFDWGVYEIKEDPDHNFVVMRQAGNTYYYKREDYVVPISDKITAFLVDDRYVTDEAACAALEQALKADGDTFTHYTENWFGDTETQHFEQLYIAYGGCPVATFYQGFIGTLDNRFIVTVEPVSYEVNILGETVPKPAECYEVPADLAAVLKPYI